MTVLTSKPVPRSPNAFTLVELLTVIAIIGVLAALTVATTAKVREATRSTRCISNLRQITQVLLLSAADNRGAFPPGWTWDQQIAPYLGVTLASPLSATPPASLLVCPSDDRMIARPRSYVVSQQYSAQPGIGVFSRSATAPSLRTTQITYPNRTILVTEFHTGGWSSNSQFSGAYAAVDGWLGATGAPLRDGSPYHGSGQHYAFADGHVERLVPAQVINQTGGFPNGGRWRAYMP